MGRDCIQKRDIDGRERNQIQTVRMEQTEIEKQLQQWQREIREKKKQDKAANRRIEGEEARRRSTEAKAKRKTLKNGAFALQLNWTTKNTCTCSSSSPKQQRKNERRNADEQNLELGKFGTIQIPTECLRLFSLLRIASIQFNLDGA